MWNSTGRGRLYRTLAAEAIAKEKGEQMVDFKALAAKRKAEMEEKKKNLTPLPIPPKAVEVKKNIREQALDDLEELIHADETSQWEKNFCKSVKSWLLKSPNNYMSVKQEAVYDKLVKGILLVRDTTSSVPTREPRKEGYSRDWEYRAPYDNDRSAPAPKSYGFEDMDDDIPF